MVRVVSLLAVTVGLAAFRVQAQGDCRAALAAANPGAQWRTTTGLRGDVTYDSVPDLLLWGVKDSTFVVAIIQCPDGGVPGESWHLDFDGRAWGTLDFDVELENPGFSDWYFKAVCDGVETAPDCVELRALQKRLQRVGASGRMTTELGAGS